MIGSAAAGFEGILLLLAAWFVFKRTSDSPQANSESKLPFSTYHVPAALLIMGVAFTIGAITAASGINWLSSVLLPVMTILVILPPIWILAGLGARKMVMGSRWRIWAIFGLGMSLNPLLMIILEIMVGIIFVFIVTLYLAAQPAFTATLMDLAVNIDPMTDPESILNALAPFILQPSIIFAILAYISVVVPLIEEMFKPLGVWLFAGKIERPAQGFGLGVMSGAAYALVEGLGVSGRGGPDWPMIVAVRAGTSLLHITTSGLMGWAIVSAVKEKRILRLLATYLTAVSIHGIWNAAAAGAGIALIASSLENSGLLARIIPAAIGGIIVLGIGLLALLIRANHRLAE